MSKIGIDWNAIQPLNGSRAKGFEELCSQLARAEVPASSQFVRKGAPDAGVECYAVLDNGDEWGWQAKYFNELGDSQWTQIQYSVGTALEKHPRLVRYFICVPLDRPDARINDRMSAKERWDTHMKTWTEWASSHKMAVEFVYWGSHELLERLVRPEHTGRVRFWFDVHRFDEPWFTARLDEALKTAGPRYTPEIHVDLPIAEELDAFGRTEQFFNGIKAQAQGIRRRLRNLGYSESRSPEQFPHEEMARLSSAVQTILSELGSITVQPIGVLPFQRIAKQIAETESEAENFRRILSDREQEHGATSRTGNDDTERAPRRDNLFRECRYHLYALSSELENAREVLEHSDSIANSNLMILNGAAGTGKTHLLCDVARQRVAKDRPTVLLMGQRFVSTDEPWTQALQQLDLAGLSAGEFVGAIETAAQVADCRALVLIDAINEGSGRLIWPSHLAAFLAHLERSPWIGVLLSIRTSYEKSLISEEVRVHAVVVTHEGFSEHEYDATQTFFAYYGLELPSTPLLSPEFRNPFFLKTLCLGLITKGEVRLPRGFHGITAIFDLYLSAVNDKLASTIGFDNRNQLVRRALGGIVSILLHTEERWLVLEKAEEVVNALFPCPDFERSLYRGLVSEGILTEECVTNKTGTHEDVVFIALVIDPLIERIQEVLHEIDRRSFSWSEYPLEQRADRVLKPEDLGKFKVESQIVNKEATLPNYFIPYAHIEIFGEQVSLSAAGFEFRRKRELEGRYKDLNQEILAYDEQVGSFRQMLGDIAVFIHSLLTEMESFCGLEKNVQPYVVGISFFRMAWSSDDFERFLPQYSTNQKSVGARDYYMSNRSLIQTALSPKLNKTRERLDSMCDSLRKRLESIASTLEDIRADLCEQYLISETAIKQIRETSRSSAAWVH